MPDTPPSKLLTGSARTFKLFFGAESWPGKGYVLPCGLSGERNIVIPVHSQNPLCQPPEGESGSWVAVTANVAELLTAALRLDDPETIERVARAVKSALQRETANGPIVDTTVLAQAAITALLGDGER